MKRLLAALLCAAMLASLAACENSAPIELTTAGDDMLGVRGYYRDSSLVVSGACSGSHIDQNGLHCSDVVIASVIAGDAAVGDVVHCAESDMTEGEEYLLYLSLGESVDYAEDIQGYTIVSGKPLLIRDGSITVDGVSLLLEDVLADIEENLSRVITAPAERYYYSRVKDLTEACDAIFIGRVTDVPQLEDTHFRSRGAGQGSDNTLPASKVTVSAIGAIKGALSYGDEVTVIYAPALAKEIIDAATLVPLSGGANVLKGLREGETYLFFLIRSLDAKQPYYFTVNPIQGYIRLEGETLDASSGNELVYGYYRLSNLVRAIKRYVA